MKKIFVIGFISIFCSCSTGSNSAVSADSANAIDNHQLDTVTSSPQPNGYAPPNTKVDTSQQRKDSINARQQ